MSDKYDQAVFEIAAYYDQTMYMLGTRNLHPKVAVLKKWMLDNINEKDLSVFQDRLYSMFNFFPKLAELNKAISEKKTEAFEIQAETAWQLLINKSSCDNVMITDESSAYVVSGYGSWHDFCLERDNNREWTHKNFIERYVSFRESGMTFKPVVLSGTFRHNYGLNFRGVVTRIIGDEAQGRKLLESNSEKVQIDNLISASLKRVK